ncbi:hypothetical protein V7127_12475 [Bacillus sp. JJ1773]|uniref:hypothetical protein n=1 Tax=Bacillus sp. JJ1773 TaxID=3122965 RepID=UPI002FFEAC0E
MKLYSHYISGSLKFGLSLGVVSLLARWATGNSIVTSPETLVKFGLVGGIGFSVMGAFTFFIFGIIAQRIRINFPQHETIGDFLKDRIKPSGSSALLWMIIFLGFDSLFVQSIGIGIFLNILFEIPVNIGLFFFLFYCFIHAGLGGMKWIQRFEGINIIFIFTGIIFLPVYFFILEGVFPIYNGIRLYHPYLLVWNNKEAILFIITAILIGFGQIITDRSTWQRIYLIEPAKIRSTFWLTGTLLGTIPLALSAMTLISIFDQRYQDSYSLLFQLIPKIDSVPLVVLIMLFFFGTFTTTANAELHATTVLIVKNCLNDSKKLTARQLYQYSYLISGLLCLVLLVISSTIAPSLHQLLFFFGKLYAALIPVMLWVVFSRRQISYRIPYSALIGWLISILFFSTAGPLLSIWISFSISLVCGFFLMAVDAIVKRDTQG